MSWTRRVSPPVLLAAAVAAIVLVLVLTTSLRMPTLVSFDESVYKLGAAQDDDVARGAARLYSLVIAPWFALLDGDVAVRAARAFTTLLWALAAVPVYLLARSVMASPRRALVAALLSVLVPWATVSTVLFSEALAYLLFCTVLLAMAWALRAPSPRRDLVVLALLAALIGTRPQFAAVPFAWLVVVVALRRSAHGFPFLFGGAALGVLAFLVLAAAGRGGTVVSRLGGPYVSGEYGLDPSVAKMAVFESAMIALGTGLVPLVLALAWLVPALRGRLDDEARRVAAVGTAAVAATWLVALAALGQWPGPDLAEERYFVYAVPLVLVGALAATELPRVAPAALAAGAALVLALLALTPATAGLSSERAFLVPVAATMTNVADRLVEAPADVEQMRRLLLIGLGLSVLGAAAVASRRSLTAALVPAVVLQLAFGGYALATMHGKVPGVPGAVADAPFAPLGWVDRTTEGDPVVSLLADTSATQMVGDVGVAFWNDEVARTTRFPGIADEFPPYPLSRLPAESVRVGADLSVTPAPATRLVVATRDSPYVQLAGRRVAAQPGGRRILLEHTGGAVWSARGLGPAELVERPVRIVAAPARLTIRFEPGPQEGRGVVVLGDRSQRVAVAPGVSADVTVDLCGADGPASGTVSPRSGALYLRAVSVEPC